MSLGGGSDIGSKGGKKGVMSIAARLREQVAYDTTIASDPKYKKYSQQVEKCLATFENMHEWPDLIAFLKQLLKTLQSYTQFKEIPRKLIVSKRLAQCLIPALPSGVHQRALDVYTHILAVLGPEGLKRELPLWSSGLFPFFEYASTSVKPTLLNLFELYFLPLQDSLRPVMRSFILALLPGLEEETGEYFEKSMSLLDRLSETVSPSFFLQNIWLIMLTTQVHRAYALNYLSRRLPRLDAEDITPIVGRDVGLMIRAFAAALADDNLLVQRAALDLLLQTVRLESAALSHASSSDRAILMRAATGVVLRRDLSLNRRLFTWLLGKDENSQAQVEYFRKHGLDMLVETLKDEMMHPSCLYTNARPFKIFISLLDKWEIGSPLTEALIYDALTAIKCSVQSTSERGEDTLITANTLYETVEPGAIWKALFTSVCKEILSGDEKQRFDAIDMFTFVLNTFRLDEEEVQRLHLPLIFAALVELLKNTAISSPASISQQLYVSATDLVERISQCVPAEVLTLRLQFSDLHLEHGYYEAASKFYALQSDPEPPYSSRTPPSSREAAKEIFVDSFTHLCSISRLCVEVLLANSEQSRSIWRVFSSIISILSNMLLVMNNSYEIAHVIFELDLDSWLDKIAEGLSLPGCTFFVVDSVVSIAASLHTAQYIRSPPSLNNRPRLLVMVNALFHYLKPAASPYHVRAVRLIWELETATANGRVEAMLAHMLAHNVSYEEGNVFEMFGVLWRLSDDAQEPGFHFKVPMLIVLDTLRSDNPSIRQAGETWMRNNLRGYPRVLDTIIVELTASTIHRSEEYVTVKGREIPGMLYERTFDQQRINYLLDILAHVIRFGGQSFARITGGVPISRSFHSNLPERLVQDGYGHADSSYTEIIISILTRFLKSEPKQSLSLPMRKLNVITQALTIEILQALVSRGEVEDAITESLEAAVIGKLFILVHTGQLELQNKLLHLLHSVVSASDALNERRKARNAIAKPQGTSSTQLEQINIDGVDNANMRPVNPLLIQLLIDGVSTPSNRPLLHHWLDFVLLTIPQFPYILASVVAPLNSCICRQLRSAIAEVRSFSSTEAHLETDVCSCVDDAQMNMLLNTLERLILLCLDEADPGSPEDSGVSPFEKPTTDHTLLSMVSNVFLPDSQTQHVHESHMTARSPGYRSLHEGVGVLYSIWSLVSEEPSKANPAFETLRHVYSRTLARCRRVMERFFRVHTFEVIESMVDYWNKSQDVNDKRETAFEIVDFLTASSQNVVHMVCESISCRINASHERGRKQALNPDLTDTVLFGFLEAYLSKLENPLAVQVWSRYLALAKDIASNVKDFRSQTYPVLRCLSVLAYKLSQTTAFDDRRVRKELQECFSKLLDAVVINCGRGSEHGTWMRRVNRDSALQNGRETSLSRVASETKLDEKSNAGAESIAESSQQAVALDTSEQICLFVANEALPNLRRFLIEGDKITTACNNIIYYIVNPSLRSKAGRIAEVEDSIVTIIEQMSRISVAFKYWRTPATDIFNDSKFFAAPAETGIKWRAIVTTMIDTDKTALTELMGKISAAPSANIFTSREYENQLRAMNIRRLAYILFSAEKNHYLPQLPAIQEKLVDLFRGGSPANVESEIYLCIRVLLCRLSAYNLSSFWPVLLAELIRSFEQVIAEPPSDGSESLQVLLSICKLIDLLLVLQTEEFQIHQWIFITDTVDVIDRPDNWFPAALMDQLAEIVSDLHISEAKRSSSSVIPDLPASRTMREPLLRGIRQIDSIHDLSTFFSHVSIMSYESVYASGGTVDWTATEDSLVQDMFTGW